MQTNFTWWRYQAMKDLDKIWVQRSLERGAGLFGFAARPGIVRGLREMKRQSLSHQGRSQSDLDRRSGQCPQDRDLLVVPTRQGPSVPEKYFWYSMLNIFAQNMTWVACGLALDPVFRLSLRMASSHSIGRREEHKNPILLYYCSTMEILQAGPPTCSVLD